MATLLRIRKPYCDKKRLNLVSAFVLVCIIQNIQCRYHVAPPHRANGSFGNKSSPGKKTDVSYQIKETQPCVNKLKTGKYNLTDDSGKTLYEKCEINEENEDETLICKEVGSKKLWWCKAGYVVDMASLECLTANKTLKEECKINEQCTGTENGNTCRLVVGTDMKCSCNDQFEIIDGKCLKVERQLYESCENEQQCNGTVNAGKCKNVGNHSFCFCNDGLVEYQGRCVEGSIGLNVTCEHVQCNKTTNAGVCGENRTCACDKVQEEGLSGIQKQLFLVVGVLFTVVVVLFIAVLVQQKKSEKSSQMESTTKPENFYKEERDGEFISTQRMHTVSESYYSVPVQSNYNSLHQNEDDKESRSGNVYDRAQPKHSFRNDEFQTDSSLYNHLHEKPFQLSAEIYDKTEGIPMPSFSAN
ncbi:uncharacterized protein LOC111109857 [Crassostrea virginica]